MKFPTAPPSRRARASIPDQWGRTLFPRQITRTTDTTPDRRVSSQVCWLNREKAAPVFCT